MLFIGKRKHFSQKDLVFIVLFLGLVAGVIWAGSYLTSFLKGHAFSEKMRDEQSSLNLLADFVRDECNEAKDIARILSGSPNIISSLSALEDEQSLERANQVLERYATAVIGGVVYLMNRDGLTIASSNRNKPASFVGKSYKFRPYFIQAMEGMPFQYFALGVTSKERGFYASAPVLNDEGVVMGVVVVKKDLSNVGLLFQEKPNSFLVSPEGVIFLASQPEYLYRTLFPINVHLLKAVEESRQFGDRIGPPLLEGTIGKEERVLYQGQEFVYLHQQVGFDQWQIVVFMSLGQVRFYHWIGMILVGFVAGLLLLFLVVYLIQSCSGALIKQQKEQAEMLFRLTPSGIFTVDTERRVTSWNSKAEEITGFAAAEVVGEKCLIFAEKPCRDQEVCRIFCEDIVKPIFGVECTIITKSGEKRWIAKNVDVLRDQEGQVIGGIESFEDITERKKLEQEIKDTQERYNLAMEVISEGVWDYYPQEERLFLSLAWFKMLGYSQNELRQGYAAWISVLHPDDVRKAQKDFREFISSGKDDYDAEFRMREKSGAWKWIFAKGRVVIRGEHGEPLRVVGTHTDITKRKEVDALKERAMGIRSKFMATVSHELRTPLGPIKEGVSIVLDGLVGKINAEQRGLLEAARRNADRLHRLINDVLDYQKLDSGVFKFRFQLEDINISIEEVCKDIRLLTKEKGLSLDVQLEMNLPKIRFDRDKIIQVLTNLLINAVKFTDAGGVTVCTRKGQGCVEVVVADTGYGIREEDVSKLFESFTQVDGPRGRSTGGSGLGLVICKEIIEKHGGKIWIESEYGKGSEVHFVLPV